jgi:Protein of unknown function (DUF2694)
MNDEPDPAFDALHRSGAILFRSCRGGFMHSVILTEQVMEADASSLVEGILRAASVSFLKAAMQVRAEVIAGQPDDGASSAVPTPLDLQEAIAALQSHSLRYRQD